MSLKLLAEQLILACPDQPAGRTEVPLYIPRELSRQRLSFHSPVVLYASPNNSGALAVAKALCAGMGRTIEVVEETSRATHMLLYLNQLTYQGDAGELLADELRAARGGAGRGRARRVSVEEGGAEQTGRARARSLFTLHRSAAPLPIVMAHENDPDKGGCEFAHCLATVPRVCGPPACLFLLAVYATLLRPPFLWARQTPHDLVTDGLYKALALALQPGPFWPVSVALLAKALGADSGARDGTGFRTADTVLQAARGGSVATAADSSRATEGGSAWRRSTLAVWLSKYGKPSSSATPCGDQEPDPSAKPEASSPDQSHGGGSGRWRNGRAQAAVSMWLSKRAREGGSSDGGSHSPCGGTAEGQSRRSSGLRGARGAPSSRSPAAALFSRRSRPPPREQLGPGAGQPGQAAWAKDRSGALAAHTRGSRRESRSYSVTAESPRHQPTKFAADV